MVDFLIIHLFKISSAFEKLFLLRGMDFIIALRDSVLCYAYHKNGKICVLKRVCNCWLTVLLLIFIIYFSTKKGSFVDEIYQKKIVVSHRYTKRNLIIDIKVRYC